VTQVAPARGEYALLFLFEKRLIKEQRFMHFSAIEIVVQRSVLFQIASFRRGLLARETQG
jgi:hypothetical protein